MSKMRAKSDLPEKTCPVCQRSFRWRKRWERDWEQVVYCSKRCRGEGNPLHHPASLRAETGKS